MGTLAQARDRVDAFLAARWPTIVARQQNYFANNGRYWQGVRTHTIVPNHTPAADGDSIGDQLNYNPSDVYGNWSNVFPDWLTTPIPCAVQVNTYDAPEGKGWFAAIYIQWNGVTYTRSQNVGPHSFWTQDWHEL